MYTGPPPAKVDRAIPHPIPLIVGRCVHECESTGTLGYWYSGRRMHECKSTGTLGYWYSLPTLTYFEVDLLSWSARWHPDSQGNPLLSLLENNHLNKAYLD
jgi:hypothetical protein